MKHAVTALENLLRFYRNLLIDFANIYDEIRKLLPLPIDASRCLMRNKFNLD